MMPNETEEVKKAEKATPEDDIPTLTIYKYDAPVLADLTIEMPENAKVLCVQAQAAEGPKIWALISPRETHKPRRFHWARTGHPVAGSGRYVGTVQAMGGALVFHLFEETP